jgi:ABC-2 type transport system permease protein
MFKKNVERIHDSLVVVWTITAKDIIDALRNRLVISLIIMGSIMLVLPRLLPYIFEQSALILPVFTTGETQLVDRLQEDPALSVLQVRSEEEFRLALCSSLYPLVGLRIPANFDQVLAAGGPMEFQGATCWNRRFQVGGLKGKLEALLSQSLDRPVTLQLDRNFVYSPSQGVFLISMAAVNLVVVILMIGFVLVPNLFFEEKQTRTLQALLVSPANISQVVTGKVFAGLFYILVTAAVMFAISWMDVVHWGVVVVFVAAGGIFSVAVGLVLGSFYEKPQDTAGLMTVLSVVLIGAILVKMIGMKSPPLVEGILPWVPSVALAELCRSVFTESVPQALIASNVGIILVVSLVLYALVVWKIRRSDR